MDTTAPGPSNSELISRARAGDAPAWEALTRRYTGLLWSIARAYRLSAADAADVVQSTWVRLLENLDRIRDPERVGSWLATTARRECLRTHRRSSSEMPVGDERVFDRSTKSALDSALLRDERDAALWSAFGTLNERCQALLRLLTADPPLSYREVSETLGMPVGAIGPTRQRCLNTLRERVRAEGLDSVDLLAGNPDPAPGTRPVERRRTVSRTETNPR